MKLRISMLVVLLTSVACSKSGGSPSGGSSPGQVTTHSAKDCPKLNGEFTLDDESSRKSLMTTETANGVQLEDTEVKWTIDAQSHAAEGGTQLSYVGACSPNKIAINLYEGTKHLGTIEYRLLETNKLEIKSVSNDPKIGKSETQVWTAKP